MKPFARIASIVAAAALALSALGCSGTQQQTSSQPGFQPEDIQVNDPGFVVTDEGKLRYAFVAVNPNECHVAQDVIFTVQAYDANGSMIAGGGETIPVIYPGIETAGAGEVDLYSPDTDTPEVANLTIVAMSDSITWVDTNRAGEDIEAALAIVSPRMTTEADGSLLIKASIGYAEEKNGHEVLGDMQARAVAVLLDESGRALCGTTPDAFELTSDGGYEFEASIPNAPKYASAVLYVTPNSLLD